MNAKPTNILTPLQFQHKFSYIRTHEKSRLISVIRYDLRQLIFVVDAFSNTIKHFLKQTEVQASHTPQNAFSVIILVASAWESANSAQCGERGNLSALPWNPDAPERQIAAVDVRAAGQDFFLFHGDGAHAGFLRSAAPLPQLVSLRAGPGPGASFVRVRCCCSHFKRNFVATPPLRSLFAEDFNSGHRGVVRSANLALRCLLHSSYLPG